MSAASAAASAAASTAAVVADTVRTCKIATYRDKQDQANDKST